MVVAALRLAAAWLSSGRHRRAFELWRQTRRLGRHRWDLLDRDVQDELRRRLDQLHAALRSRASEPALEAAVQGVERFRACHLAPPRRRFLNEAWENVLLITLAILVLRAFFLLPSEIPSGSMQPTLWGVTVVDRREDPLFRVPTGWRAWVERWLFGRTYWQVTAVRPGLLEEVAPVEPGSLWRLPRLRFRVGGVWYSLPAPSQWPASPFRDLPDEQAALFLAGLRPGHWYKQGEPIIRAVLQAGDHVLIDRFSYHWRRPKRGEIVVFRSGGLEGLEDDTYYLKRLVGLPGERMRIGDDRHVWIDGRRLDRETPGFEKLYDFRGPPRPSVYSGHLNARTGRRYFPRWRWRMPWFPDGNTEVRIPAGHYVLLGDNTVESLDSRHFGPVAAERIVGRVWLVYWPWGTRLGAGRE
ncbi:MAG: signal peptidase I [Verrucomicrobia bacterium]|nr:MAG: signal peptidase I [Verrucomicrobiota bacterium]